MKKNKVKIYRELKRSLTLLSFITTNLSVLVFAFLEFNISIREGRNADFHLPDALGMIIPYGAVMGVVTWISLRKSYKYMSALLFGLKRVAEGNFKKELEISNAGPYKEIFLNFNKMQRELESTKTLREDFINHFSHEFKTPIMSINGFATLLLKEDLPREEQIRYLETISAESKRLAELSRNSLLLTKLESTEIQTESEIFLLDEQIRECVILLSPLWTKKNIDLSADLFPMEVKADRTLMKQVWINLLTNAITYTPEGGSVTITQKGEKNRCSLSIRDTGMGIDEEDLSRIFTKFHKGKNVYKSAGLGLGLSIVKRILDISGGSVKAESVPGEGSCFTVILPCIKN